MGIQRASRLIAAGILAVAAAGCCAGGGETGGALVDPKKTIPASQPTAIGLTAPQAMDVVEALVNPPEGWKPDPLRVDAKHAHAVWISPSHDTAYGVVLMRLPLPVGTDMVLWGFLKHLKESDGDSQLISKSPDSALPGMRFVADSGRYRIRVNLIVQGWKAWAVYAGTYREHAINSAELELAEVAREHTKVALPPQTASAE